MIRVGEHYLSEGNLDKAVQTFQEAINIDTENGVAYYYLAKGLYQKQNYDDALGVLEKSEALLANYSDWVAEIKRLRNQIQETKANPPPSLQQTEYQKWIYH